ncbi:unnamed protein product [Parnassius apollo]|uniref:(apollo) hypothetical protein n=1 Tax=Parnassius apollo TaxID=110799 RepID=A0A8S3XY74_PARAO|nr:unnamed protein product [Parnassius apollo]
MTTRIIGGYRAPQEFGRFHTSLQNLTGHHVCGGAVVSRRHVLTAAHCVNRVEPQYIKVVVGTTDLDKGGKKYSVKHIHIYKGYNSNQKTNDIAIINIKGLFSSNYVDILKLPKTQLRDGDEVIISGFGAQEAHGISSRHMYALNLTVFCQETCSYAMRYSREVTNTMFCTFTRIGQGTCHGDSGGPLIQGNTIVGLVSWGIPCAVGFPDVHTRIYPYVHWIRAKIQKKRRETFSAIQVKTKIELSERSN